MLTLYNAVKNVSRVKKHLNLIQTRNYQQFIGSGVCTMPRNRLSKGRKFLMVSAMFGWWFPYPIWLLWNFENLKGPSGSAE